MRIPDNSLPQSHSASDSALSGRGWFLGDGTGAGKGRQVAGIILDNWLKGRRRAVWVSKSDKLIDDAQRDWSALGQERLLITPLARFRQGTPIRLAEGILFTTYATLRGEGGEGKQSRVQQILDWLGRDFDGVIVFDESHALANAAGEKSERGDKAASQQGRAGLRLQHALPDARVLYVSATGATTVHNLAYAQRLGLWGGADFPFATRAEFVQAIEAGGVAAMEVLARDLKALGLYASRSLSYEGVEYELVEHALTPEQTRIYDAYAGAFQIIHNNLTAALEATNVTGSSGTLNAQAKSAARSAFESAKQRFFNHLITAMKTPTLIASIDRDLAAGHAAIVQIVSTGEALMERRLAEIPTEEWGDVSVDITPREYVLDYLAHSFPTQLFEPFTDEEGNLSSRPVFRDGQPVQCRDAVERRDRMIERLAALPPVPGALDQIVQRFGTDQVAEVTGRSRRIVRKGDRLASRTAPAPPISPKPRPSWTTRSASSSSPTPAAPDAPITPISARGTGACASTICSRPAGRPTPPSRASAARTAPTRRSRRCSGPVATNVKAEKRFLSTIARRLDTLGAITRGQRQTGGQGLFRADDNLESVYGRAALRQLYFLLYSGKVEGCSLQAFEDATGLSLTDRDGGLRDELPPITTFLNRLLALTIDSAEHAVRGVRGIADREDRRRHRLGHLRSRRRDADRREPLDHRAPDRSIRIRRPARRRRCSPSRAATATSRSRSTRRWRWRPIRAPACCVNARSGRAAVQMPAPSLMLDDGEIERRVRLFRPMERTRDRGRRAGRDALARGRPRRLRRRLAGRGRGGSRILDQQLPYRHRPLAADLDAAAGGELPRLSASDR